MNTYNLAPYPGISQPYQRANPKYLDAMRESQNQMASARTGSFRNNFGDVQVQNANRGFLSNSNPAIMGGIANVSIGNDQFRVLNPMLQQAMFTDSFNRGNSNYVGDLFGLNRPQPQDMGYRNMDVVKQQLERQIYANPQLTQNQYVDPRLQYNANRRQAMGDIQGRMGQGYTEKRNAQGEMMGVDQQKKDQEDLAMLNSRQNPYDNRTKRIKGQEEAGRAAGMRIDAAPTYSNVPVREKLI